MRFLITQSLLSSWAYTFNAYEGYEEDAYEDFLRTLRREPGEQTDAMKKGIDFENLVYSIAGGTYKAQDGKQEAYYEGASKVAEIIKGAPVQVKASRELEIGGMTFLVYGILDALKAGTIYDVKYLNGSLGSTDVYGKYLSSAQHPAYFYIVPEAKEFKYLLSDGQDIYIEEYRREDTRFIGDIIEAFIRSISGWNLLDLYREKWQAQ